MGACGRQDEVKINDGRVWCRSSDAIEALRKSWTRGPATTSGYVKKLDKSDLAPGGSDHLSVFSCLAPHPPAENEQDVSMSKMTPFRCR